MSLAERLRALPVARFLKFCVVGGSGVVVNYAVYLPLTRWLGLLEETALVASIAVSIFTNFLLNEAWTFRDRRTGGSAGKLRRLGRFYLVSLGGAVIQWGVSMICFRWLGIDDRLAVLVGIGVATAWNFVVNLLWTWKKTARPPGDAAA